MKTNWLSIQNYYTTVYVSLQNDMWTAETVNWNCRDNISMINFHLHDINVDWGERVAEHSN